ncbi:glycerophosphodiester phosphodiesterase [Pseudonocardia phyllosphaerae]|uniref:glycerophosphodiester phosphodiesterase n=1 Tax=Pseudonocardia phyllosphaerae TaxID=3390502 RepID=UPI00397A42E1
MHPSPVLLGRVEVVAHRGASADAPENTLAAVDAAVAQGADTIETDVQRTVDGHLVLLHDSGPARTTDARTAYPARTVRVGALTLAELRDLDAGSWFGDVFAGERVPTLAELLDRTGGRAGLLLELKDPARHPGIEAQVAAAVAGRDGVTVQSFDHAAMRRFTSLAPGVPAGWLFDARPTAGELDAAAGFAAQINVEHHLVDGDLVRAVTGRGMTAGAWTVNDEPEMRRLADLGVARVISDRPQVLRGAVGG